MDLKELEAVDPDHHWYYLSKFSAISSAVNRCGFHGGLVIDVGAGSGFFSIRLARQYPGTSAFCVDPNYPTEQLHTDGDVRFTHHIEIEDKRDASLFLFVDVLEHVSDDSALLSDYVRHASPGALVAITVPAFMSLWSGHDVFLEHFRRYRLREVIRLVEASRLQVLHSQYLFGSTFLPLWVVRRLTRDKTPVSQMAPAPALVNRGLTRLLTVEHQLLWNPIAGSSAMVIARVPSGL